MKQLYVILFTVLLSGFTTQVLADEFISQKSIESSARGYLIKGTEFKEVRIMGVKSAKNKKSECRVHKDSIVKALKSRVDDRDPTAGPVPVRISLQATISFGQVKCIGIGSGCIVDVIVWA